MDRQKRCEEVKEYIEKRGYVLLSDYKNRNTKMHLRCPGGHDCYIRWSIFIRNIGCRICGKKKAGYNQRISFDRIKKYIEGTNYIVLSKEADFKNRNTKISVKCPEGHTYEVKWHTFLKGCRCRQCHCNDTRKKIDEIKKYIEKEGYELLSKEKDYRDSQTVLKVKCPEGHMYEVKWHTFLKGCRCPKCSVKKRGRNLRISFDNIKKCVEKEGYKLLSKKEDYRDSQTKIKIECPEGHIYNIKCVSFLAKSRQKRICKICNKEYYIEKRKNSFNEVKKYIENEKYELISKEYINGATKMHLKCPKGHDYYTNWNNFQQGYRCSSCYKPSQVEENLFKIYSDLNPKKDRTQIKPKELDLYFPDHKVAVEYCGLYWHSNAQKRISSSYHRNKMDKCNEKGIRLLTIFEDEYLHNKDICISRINNTLGICDQRIFARKCKVRQIDKKLAKEFLNRTHLQGYGRCKIAYGLFYQDTLMQVMTWGSPARAHTAKGRKVLEMKRFAGELNTIVVGGAGKLFKLGLGYAQQEGYETLKSYCDLRWGTGNLYEKLGFTKTHETKYTPHYTDFIKRYRNQTLATNKKKEGKTEAQKANEKKLYKIYDCGHSTWEYEM